MTVRMERSRQRATHTGRHKELFETMVAALNEAGVTREELDDLLRLPPDQVGEAFHEAVNTVHIEPRKSLREIQAGALESRRVLVSRGELLSSEELARRIGLTRQAVNKAVQAGRMFSLEVGAERFVPAFFADPQVDRRTLERISTALGDIPGWSKWQFFTSAKGSLEGRTPLDALKSGSIERVERAARAFAER